MSDVRKAFTCIEIAEQYLRLAKLALHSMAPEADPSQQAAPEAASEAETGVDR